MTQRKSSRSILFVIGLIAIAFSFILEHYLSIHDFIYGISYGIGIGLIILGLVKQKHIKTDRT